MANGHGGKRHGAGRKNGSRLRRTAEVALELSRQGITPLAVLLDAMREHHAAGRKDRAAEVARDAAPYCHPRLSAVQHEHTFPDADADAALAALLSGPAARGAGEGDSPLPAAPDAGPGNGRPYP